VLLLALVEALLLGGYLLHGGLYTDDWPIAAIQHQSGSWGLFKGLVDANHERLLGALYLSITTAAMGVGGSPSNARAAPRRARACASPVAAPDQ
jgi:hypothetical protein